MASLVSYLNPFNVLKLELPFLRFFLSKVATPSFMVSVFTLVNILNYVDRGVIPGAYESLGRFIRADLQVTSTDFYVGVLQSMYIVGFAVSCVAFGHASMYFDSFKLMCLGLSIWVGAMFLSAWAPNYWILVAARVLSGAGEGSFQTVVPPFIDDNAPPSKRGLWLALFFCGIPVGTALGNVYGGYVSEALSWRAAFAFIGLFMVPFVVLIWHAPSPGVPASVQPRQPSSIGSGGATATPAGFTANALASAANSVGEREIAKVLSSAGGRQQGSIGGGLIRSTPASPQQRKIIAESLREDAYAAPRLDLGFHTDKALEEGDITSKHGAAAPFATGEGGGAAAASGGGGGSGSIAGVGLVVEQPQQQQHIARLKPSPSYADSSVEPGSYVALGEEVEGPGESSGGGGGAGTGFFAELRIILTDPLFLAITFGYAGFGAVLAGLASFGPNFCQVRFVPVAHIFSPCRPPPPLVCCPTWRMMNLTPTPPPNPLSHPTPPTHPPALTCRTHAGLGPSFRPQGGRPLVWR
jgi:MFS family permease